MRITIGSRILGLESESSDYDYIEVVEEPVMERPVKDGRDHIMKMTRYQIEDQLSFSSSAIVTLFNYMFDEAYNPDLEFHYHVLDHADRYAEVLKMYFDPFIKSSERYGRVVKVFYHLVVGYFILLNGSPVLTDEQMGIVKSFHDKTATVDDAKHYRELFNELYESRRK